MDLQQIQNSLRAPIHVSIKSHDIGYLPIKKKKIVRTQYINVYITCLSKIIQNYPHQLYSIDKQKSNNSFKSKFSKKKIKYKLMLIFTSKAYSRL